LSGYDRFSLKSEIADDNHLKEKLQMDYMCCDKCGSEFIIKDAVSTSVKCPECAEWIDLEPISVYSSRYYGKGYSDEYVDFDMDNYGYND